MTTKQRKIVGNVSLAAVFIMMCALQLWFTMLILFAFGLILTLLSRRRNFCSAYCPMGTVQDAFYKKHEYRNEKLYRLLQSRSAVIIFAAVFWGAISASIFLLHPVPDKLWQAMLSIMLGSAAVAVLLQNLTRKRVWCSTICPYGNILGQVVKRDKK